MVERGPPRFKLRRSFLKTWWKEVLLLSNSEGVFLKHGGRRSPSFQTPQEFSHLIKLRRSFIFYKKPIGLARRGRLTTISKNLTAWRDEDVSPP